ncbi:MAG: hypothetical protein F6K58_27825 [Symploca sp. SIO2E9]|nr:hypothetical protein [Symploca sp. SIO2E9]
MGERVSTRSRRPDAQTLQTRRIEIPTKMELTLNHQSPNALPSQDSRV